MCPIYVLIYIFLFLVVAVFLCALTQFPRGNVLPNNEILRFGNAGVAVG